MSIPFLQSGGRIILIIFDIVLFVLVPVLFGAFVNAAVAPIVVLLYFAVAMAPAVLLLFDVTTAVTLVVAAV